MPRLSIEARRRIVSLYSCGYSVPVIVQRLEQEDVKVSKRAVYDLVKKFRLKGVVKDLPRRKKARILTGEMKRPATRVIALRATATRGSTRDVYVPRHEKSWSTQTRYGNI